MILHCDMCPKLKKKMAIINLRNYGVYNFTELKAKIGWTAHEGGIHMCKECNEVYVLFGELRETAIVDKLDIGIHEKKNGIIAGEISEDEKTEPIVVIEICDLCDFEGMQEKVKKHKQAYHYKELKADDLEITVFKCPLCIFIDTTKGVVTRHVNTAHINDTSYLSELQVKMTMTSMEYREMKDSYDDFFIFICIQTKCNFLTIDQYVYKNHRRIEHQLKVGRPSKIRVTEEDYQKLLEKKLIKVELDNFYNLIYPVYECPLKNIKNKDKCWVTYRRDEGGMEAIKIHQMKEHKVKVDGVIYRESFRTKWLKRKESE